MVNACIKQMNESPEHQRLNVFQWEQASLLENDALQNRCAFSLIGS